MAQIRDNKSASEVKPETALYFGKVMHARMKPVEHRFNYRIFSLLIDLDQYDKAQNLSAFFSINRRNIVSFQEKDHGPRDGTSLRKHINGLLVDGGMDVPDKVFLWCNPRVFGYAFNPLSIYFCYDKSDHVTALVYQVHNTFGEGHSYVGKVNQNQTAGASIRNTAAKRFYVSPFLDMNLRYDFRINPPEELLRIRILEHDNDGPILSATFSGHKRLIKMKNLALGILQTIGLSWKIITGIHFEALLLWFKGMKVRSRPKPPERPSYMQSDKNVVAGE